MFKFLNLEILYLDFDVKNKKIKLNLSLNLDHQKFNGNMKNLFIFVTLFYCFASCFAASEYYSKLSQK